MGLAGPGPLIFGLEHFSEKYDSSKIIERNQRIIKKYQSLVRSAIALDALLESEQYEISNGQIS